MSALLAPRPCWLHAGAACPPSRARGGRPPAASKAILALEGVVDHGLFLDMVSLARLCMQLRCQ